MIKNIENKRQGDLLFQCSHIAKRVAQKEVGPG